MQLGYWRFVLSACFAVVTLAAITPARAADTSYLSLVGPNPYTGPCPVTLTFNGSIAGPGNSSVTYLWARFVNGKSTDSAPITTTIPANGTLTLVPQQLAVDTTTAGFQSYSLVITSPSGSDSDTHGKVYFTVTCGPAPPPGSRNIVSEAPANVVAITDLAACTKRAPSMACGFILADATASKSLVLGWDVAKVISFHPGTISTPPDGFKLYRVDGGRNDFITKQPFENTRVSEIPKPSDGSYIGKCYAVTAYNTLAESSASAPYCIGMRLPIFHTVLHPINWAFRYRYHQRGLYFGPTTKCSDLCVGWYHDSSNGTDLGDQVGIAWRGYLLFGRSTIHGLHVTRATLKLLNTGDSGCVDKVSRALSDWWDNTSWVDGAFGHESSVPSADNSSGAVIDVTLSVQLWASGQEPNYGFVITGRNEDTGANDTTHCVSHFNPSAVLDIEQ